MIRRRLAALALITCTIAPAGFIVSTPPVGAAAVVDASYLLERYYYSDSTYSTEVGGFVRYCSGHTSSWGQQTPYYRDYKEICSRN